MRQHFFATCIVLSGLGIPARAETPDPLRLMPKQADLIVKIDSPQRLMQAVTTFGPLHQLLKFDAVRDGLDSTNSRRFFHFVEYVEKSLGAKWPELIDKLAGGGIAWGLKFENPPPTLLIVQGKDEALMKRVVGLLLEVVEQEQTRQDVRDRVQKVNYRGLDAYQVGDKLFGAVAGSALLLSDRKEALQAAIDLYINGSQESLARDEGPTAARKLLPGDALAWVWINMARVHEMPEAKEAYKYPRGDPGQVVLFGGLTDVSGKAPLVAIGAYRTEDGFATTVKMAAGRDATPPDLALHLPPAGQPGSLPLIEPNNVLFSTSFYLDIGKLWTERAKLLTEQPRKGIEDAEKNLGRFLAGKKLSEILTQVGPYHRLVAVAPGKNAYKRQPDQSIPAFAFLSNMRDPGYGNAMEGILRAVALFAGAQARLKLTEETINGVKLVGYRFPDDGTLANDVGNFRFNFSPCFAKVGGQFVVASTIELGRDLIPLLQNAEVSDPKNGSAATSRTRLYSEGGVALLKAFEDQLVTQTILNRAVSSEQAKKEVAEFVKWLGGLGVFQIEVEYKDHEFRQEFRFKTKPAARANVPGGARAKARGCMTAED